MMQAKSSFGRRALLGVAAAAALALGAGFGPRAGGEAAAQRPEAARVEAATPAPAERTGWPEKTPASLMDEVELKFDITQPINCEVLSPELVENLLVPEWATLHQVTSLTPGIRIYAKDMNGRGTYFENLRFYIKNLSTGVVWMGQGTNDFPASYLPKKDSGVGNFTCWIGNAPDQENTNLIFAASLNRPTTDGGESSEWYVEPIPEDLQATNTAQVELDRVRGLSIITIGGPINENNSWFKCNGQLYETQIDGGIAFIGQSFNLEFIPKEGYSIVLSPVLPYQSVGEEARKIVCIYVKKPVVTVQSSETADCPGNNLEGVVITQENHSQMSLSISSVLSGPYISPYDFGGNPYGTAEWTSHLAPQSTWRDGRDSAAVTGSLHIEADAPSGELDIRLTRASRLTDEQQALVAELDEQVPGFYADRSLCAPATPTATPSATATSTAAATSQPPTASPTGTSTVSETPGGGCRVRLPLIVNG